MAGLDSPRGGKAAARLLSWVPAHSQVLDLGCGDGALLRLLRDEKEVIGYGVEIDPDNILACLEQGINVLEQDIDRGLQNFDSDSFDMVIMTQTLQIMRHPHRVLEEMLRIGRECIVTFPNLGFWRTRLQLLLHGRIETPGVEHWYDTPNIRHCTVRDFEELCARSGVRILDRAWFSPRFRGGFLVRLWPNLFTMTALYRLGRQ